MKPPVYPLPFIYESTGAETRFTNGYDPEARSRRVFTFHRPETLAEWLRQIAENPDLPTFRARLKAMPPLDERGLWGKQAEAIRNLEQSLAEDRPRSLIQMATGSGKTFTAANVCYRLIKHADAKRILFLVDRSNLGKQAKLEFDKFTIPETQRKFPAEYNVQHLTHNTIDATSRVCISTVQRIFSILKGEAELDQEIDEHSVYELPVAEPVEVSYNPALPPDTFDVIIIDECHRSIYGLWRQVLEYFDAHLIGLTATPTKQTFGFFRQNLVMEYSHDMAVTDGVNVDFTVYKIETAITKAGSTIEAGEFAGYRDRQTRKVRWDAVDEPVEYTAAQLDRAVVAEDQIRTVIQTFKDKLFTELFPGRKTVPKTLIFAKDDSHADDIVQIVREVFGKGNQFATKITYRTQRRQARGPAAGVPQLDVPPDRGHGGHDRDRDRRQAAGMPGLHAEREEPDLLRADARPGRPGHRRHRVPVGHRRRQAQGPVHRGGRGRRHGHPAGRDRAAPGTQARPEPGGPVQAGRLRQQGPAGRLLHRRAAGPPGQAPDQGRPGDAHRPGRRHRPGHDRPRPGRRARPRPADRRHRSGGPVPQTTRPPSPRRRPPCSPRRWNRWPPTPTCATRSSTSASPTSRPSTRCPRTRCSSPGTPQRPARRPPRWSRRSGSTSRSTRTTSAPCRCSTAARTRNG